MYWIMAPVSLVIGYLLGSIPVGVLACGVWGVDIQSVGSGRTGTTNAWRAAGLKAAIPTVIGDAIKGAVAIILVTYIFNALFKEPTTMSVNEAINRTTALQLSRSLAGGFAVIGHIWSVFLGFKGGAGGITGAATTMALNPVVGGIVWIVGAFLFWWSRIASIATISVGITTFAVFLMFTVQDWVFNWPELVYGIIIFVPMIYTLRTNREKLKNGEERIVSLW